MKSCCSRFGRTGFRRPCPGAPPATVGPVPMPGKPDYYWQNRRTRLPGPFGLEAAGDAGALPSARRGPRVLDLGCSPGSWSLMVLDVLGGRGVLTGSISTSRRQAPAPAGVHFHTGRLHRPGSARGHRGPGPFDVVLSDAAPPLGKPDPGHRALARTGPGRDRCRGDLPAHRRQPGAQDLPGRQRAGAARLLRAGFETARRSSRRRAGRNPWKPISSPCAGMRHPLR